MLATAKACLQELLLGPSTGQVRVRHLRCPETKASFGGISRPILKMTKWERPHEQPSLHGILRG